MSTDWDLHCIDCDSEHGFSDWNWGNRDIRLLWNNREQIAGVVDQDGNCCVELTTDCGRRVDAKWFRSHKNHNVRIKSEYGAFDDDCNETVKCSCGHWGYCRLSIGHEGAHDIKVEK